jgi:hypothetical protein
MPASGNCATSAPVSQVSLGRSAHQIPSASQMCQVARALPETAGMQVAGISERAAIVSGLAGEQPRYYLQFVRLATGHGGNPVSLEELRGQAGNKKPGSTDETAALF